MEEYVFLIKLTEYLEENAKQSGDCILVPEPYRQFYYKGKRKTLKRLVYSTYYGVELGYRDRPVATCGNPNCINPEHLEIVKEIKDGGHM